MCIGVVKHVWLRSAVRLESDGVIVRKGIRMMSRVTAARIILLMISVLALAPRAFAGDWTWVVSTDTGRWVERPAVVTGTEAVAPVGKRGGCGGDAAGFGGGYGGADGAAGD